jgi:hypothetical protein
MSPLFAINCMALRVGLIEVINFPCNM